MTPHLIAACMLLAAGVGAQQGLPPRTRERVSGAVIRSDKWVVHRKLGQEEFIGNVSYEHEGEAFRSDWALWDKTEQVFHAKGRAYASRLRPPGELLEFWAQQGGYDFKTLEGTAEAGPGDTVRFRRTSETGEILEGTGKRATWNGEEQTLTVLESVSVRGSSETARCERALYSVPDRTIRLTGGPPLVAYEAEGMSGVLQAEAVELAPDQGRLWARGAARGWVTFADKEQTHAP